MRSFEDLAKFHSIKRQRYGQLCKPIDIQVAKGAKRGAVACAGDTPADRGSMEMHQVRYFLAVARMLNFTRAASECNVAQPSLTRAIRQLEEEFGGDLFRRERPHAQLTDLGNRMVPLLQQCYDGALGARSLASSIKSGEIGALRIALSHTIDLAIMIPQIVDLRKHFKHLELKLLRGTAPETAEFLKDGRAEVAIASSLGDAWERLDRWPLYAETFHLVANNRHTMADREVVALEDVRGEPLLIRAYCEHATPLADLCRNHGLNIDHAHELNSPHDLVVLLEQGFGITFAPHSEPLYGNFMRKSMTELNLRRTIFLYAVAGRQHTPVASTFMRSLRGADWSRFSN
jgi:DNA-binding transcriptional LysR family regulator